MKSITLIFAVVVIVNDSCKKYEEGPAISLLSKKARVANIWKIEKYYENGLDLTANKFSAKDITIDLSKDGNVTWSEVNLSNMNGSTSTGTWEFTKSKESILLKISGSLTFNGTGTDVWDILKLKNKEFWFTVMDGNDKIEVHLVPK